jgi:hypothetical protein
LTSRIGVSVSHYGTAAALILKERMFGLTDSEGNQCEDVKELYYFEDATPTHSQMRMPYKYPRLPSSGAPATTYAGAE